MNNEPIISKTWTEESAIELYQRILDGEVDTFPRGFWDRSNAKEISGVVVRYLFEKVLKFNHDEIADKASIKLLSQYKLSGMLRGVFGNSPLDAINNAYPSKFNPWEIHAEKGLWSQQENCANAAKWLFEEKLQWTDEEIKKNLKTQTFRDHKLINMLFICFHNSVFEAVNTVYPNQFKPWELKSVPQGFWTLEKGIEATRWLFDEKLKWDLEDPKKKFSVTGSVFRKNGLSGMFQYVFNSSVYQTMKNSYPEYDWEMFNLPK